MPELWIVAVIVVAAIVVVAAVVWAVRSARRRGNLGGHGEALTEPLNIPQKSPVPEPVDQAQPSAAPVTPTGFTSPLAPADQARGLGWMKASDLAKHGVDENGRR